MYKNTIKFGITTAIISFMIGSLILLSYIIVKDLSIAVSGYFYLICASIINLIIVIFLLFKAYNKKEKRKIYFKTILIMLINIPIAFIYFLIAMQIL